MLFYRKTENTSFAFSFTLFVRYYKFLPLGQAYKKVGLLLLLFVCFEK